MLSYFFEAPTQSAMMIDDTVRLVCMYTLLLAESFRLQIQLKSVMVWTGDESQTGIVPQKRIS